MEYTVVHLPDMQRFETTIDEYTGFVTYRIVNNSLDILHTIVPIAIEGQGVAASLVRTAYDYARENGMKCKATCPYAVAWLRRHPDYVE